MDILVLQGPNLNLIGVQSAKVGERVTLDKINKELRQHAHSVSLEIQLRFLQTRSSSAIVKKPRELFLLQPPGDDMNIQY